jgi:predicted transcriptional regulator
MPTTAFEQRLQSLGLTKGTVAAESGVPRTVVYEVARGVRDVRVSTAVVLAQYLRRYDPTVTVESLFPIDESAS